MFNSAREAMDYQYKLNSQLAEDNRNWQERMANSAHQREIADLKKAGLNPVLSITGGSGANTPTGSTASVSDGAGYFSALANLEATKINSATQRYMHDTPSANSPLGAVEYFLEQFGDLGNDTASATAAILQKVGQFFVDSKTNSDKYKEDRANGIMVEIATTEADMLYAELSGDKKKYRKAEKRLRQLRNRHPKVYREYLVEKESHK